jgi:hypothetical protein
MNQLSWGTALRKSLWVETLCVILVVVAFAIFGGPDNPIPFGLILLIQFPSSLLMFLTYNHLHIQSDSIFIQFGAIFGPIFVCQTLLLIVWLRKPWRTSVPMP